MYKQDIMIKLNMWNLMYELFEFNNEDVRYVWSFSDEEREAYLDLSMSLGWGITEINGLRCKSQLVEGRE